MKEDASHWRKVIQGQRQLLKYAKSPGSQHDILVRIGEIYLHELGEVDGAIEAYREAFTRRPESKEIAMLLVDLYHSEENYQGAVDLIHELCSTESNPVVMGQYYAQLATLYRDELGDPDSALDFLSLTLDANFNHIPAFEAIVEILEDREAWDELSDQYTEMIQRTEELGFLLKSRLEGIDEQAKAAAAAPKPKKVVIAPLKLDDPKPAPSATVEPEAAPASAVAPPDEEPEPGDQPDPEDLTDPVQQPETESRPKMIPPPALEAPDGPSAEAAKIEATPTSDDAAPTSAPDPEDQIIFGEPDEDAFSGPLEHSFSAPAEDELSVSDEPAEPAELPDHAAAEPSEASDTPFGEAEAHEASGTEAEKPEADEAEAREASDTEAEKPEAAEPNEEQSGSGESKETQPEEPETAAVEKPATDDELDDSENPFLDTEKSTPDYQAGLLKDIAQKEADGDWNGVIEAMQSLLETMPEKQHKFTILKKIGGIYRDHLKDRKRAVEAYREALEQSKDRDLLEKLLEIYITTTDYEPAIEILPQLIEIEQSEKKLADHHFTLAVLYRDQKNDNENALLNYNSTLDYNPRKLQAFESIDRLLTREGNWDRLTDNYRKMIERVIGREDHVDLLFTLYRNLGEIYRTRLRDIPAAIDAFESAVAVQPDSIKIRKMLCQLLDLQSSKDPSFLDKAARQHHELLLHKPEQTESYKALCKIYFLQKAYDRAWCICNVLHAFQQGDLNQHNFFLEHRLAGLPNFSKPLQQEEFDELFVPKEINPHIGKILSLVGPAIQTKNAPPLKQFVKKKQRVDLNSDSELARTASQALKMCNLGYPDVYVSDKVTHCEVPFAKELALIIGETAQTWEPKALGFLVGFNSVFLQPEYYLASTGNKVFLTNCVYAALQKASPDFQLPMNDEAQAIRSRLDTLDDLQIKELERIVGQLMSDGGQLNLTEWLNHVDVIGIRLGLLVCSDFEMALSVISQSNALRFLSKEHATQELARFISSLRFLELREQMGTQLVTES